jgi:hypothetical protein
MNTEAVFWAGHARTPRVSISRSIFPLINDRYRIYFGRGDQEEDQIGLLDKNTRAIFGRGYAAEPDILIEQLRKAHRSHGSLGSPVRSWPSHACTTLPSARSAQDSWKAADKPPAVFRPNSRQPVPKLRRLGRSRSA